MNTKKYFKYLILTGLMFIVLFVFFFYFYLYPLKYKKEIIEYGKIYNVKPELICAIICTESKFNKSAISSKGAVGLMQIMPKTAEWLCEKEKINYSYQNLFEPQFNIRLGTKYIKYLQEKFNDEELVVMAYNAGEGTVNAWLLNNEYSQNGKTISIVPYKETKTYLQKVKNAKKVYKSRLNLV